MASQDDQSKLQKLQECPQAPPQPSPPWHWPPMNDNPTPWTEMLRRHGLDGGMVGPEAQQAFMALPGSDTQIPVQVDYSQVSKKAEERRQRNAMASTRHRRRKKIMLEENTKKLQELRDERRQMEMRIKELIHERDHYRHELDRLTDIVSQTPLFSQFVIRPYEGKKGNSTQHNISQPPSPARPNIFTEAFHSLGHKGIKSEDSYSPFGTTHGRSNERRNSFAPPASPARSRASSFGSIDSGVSYPPRNGRESRKVATMKYSDFAIPATEEKPNGFNRPPLNFNRILEPRPHPCLPNEYGGIWSQNQSTSQGSSSLVVACPFYKLDPIGFHGCTSQKFLHILHLRDHLLKNHTNSFSNNDCDRCSLSPCLEYSPPRRVPRAGGILSDEQEKQLGKLDYQSNSTSEAWFRIWDTIFPDERRPSSCSVGNCMEVAIPLFQELWRAQGTNIVDYIMTTEKEVQLSFSTVYRLSEQIIDRLKAETLSAHPDQ